MIHLEIANLLILVQSYLLLARIVYMRFSLFQLNDFEIFLALCASVKFFLLSARKFC